MAVSTISTYEMAEDCGRRIHYALYIHNPLLISRCSFRLLTQGFLFSKLVHPENLIWLHLQLEREAKIGTGYSQTISQARIGSYLRWEPRNSRNE